LETAYFEQVSTLFPKFFLGTAYATGSKYTFFGLFSNGTMITSSSEGDVRGMQGQWQWQ
jgi:hypothetical protein